MDLSMTKAVWVVYGKRCDLKWTSSMIVIEQKLP